MEEDIKIENIKDGCKISVPIISNQELDDFNNILDIESEYEKLIKKVSEQVYKEKECILLQQIIKKQERTIENLIARNKDLEKQMGKDLDVVYLQGVYNERDRWKSKVREKIEMLEREKQKAIEHDDFISVADEAQIQLCEELLQEGDK